MIGLAVSSSESRARWHAEGKNDNRVAVRVLRGDAGANTHTSKGINDGPIAGMHNECIIYHRRSPVQKMDACGIARGTGGKREITCHIIHYWGWPQLGSRS